MSSRRRSVSTRVLPEPAGAIIRAGPAPWVTAAAGPEPAPSRTLAVDLGRRRQQGEPVQLDGIRVDEHHGFGRSRRGPVQRSARRPAVGARPVDRRRSRPGGRRAAARPPDHPAWPGPRGARPCGPTTRRVPFASVVGVGPDKEVQAIEPRLRSGLRRSTAPPPTTAGHGSGPDPHSARRRRDAAPTRPGGVSRPSRPARARSRRRSGSAGLGPRARDRPAGDDHDAATEGGRTGRGHALDLTWGL